jgi:hypothetical protein
MHGKPLHYSIGPQLRGSQLKAHRQISRARSVSVVTARGVVKV